ncbi:MAG: cobalamin ABC transporter ATP-binding protein [Terriglobia bacterium]|nr:MAG: cobalamin ABC transporter ATP-binding protein [Terriglobia bacterium]
MRQDQQGGGVESESPSGTRLDGADECSGSPGISVAGNARAGCSAPRAHSHRPRRFCHAQFTEDRRDCRAIRAPVASGSTSTGVGGALTALLEARNVEFSYSAGSPVIRELSLTVKAGTLCALVGANGCGKSTLIRLFASLLTPAQGEILFGGTRLPAVGRREIARRIAYVPQAAPMVFPFTVLEVVLTGRSPYTPRFHFEDESDRARALEALATVDAAHLAARRVTELSGGERQMVAVARALAQEPQCLLLDEPSSALDLKHRAALVRTLAALRDAQGLTVLMVTQDLALIDPLFDYAFALRAGELAAEGPPAEVLRDPVLTHVYDDPHIRTSRVEGRTLIWSD